METQAPQERQSQETRALCQGVTKKPGRGSASLVPLLRPSGQSRALTHVTSSSYTLEDGLGKRCLRRRSGPRAGSRACLDPDLHVRLPGLAWHQVPSRPQQLPHGWWQRHPLWTPKQVLSCPGPLPISQFFLLPDLGFPICEMGTVIHPLSGVHLRLMVGMRRRPQGLA